MRKLIQTDMEDILHPLLTDTYEDTKSMFIHIISTSQENFNITRLQITISSSLSSSC